MPGCPCFPDPENTGPRWCPCDLPWNLQKLDVSRKKAGRKPKYSAEVKQQALTLRSDGYTYKQIHELLGVETQYTRRWWRNSQIRVAL